MSAHPSVADATPSLPALPLAVQVGFAGARRLIPDGKEVNTDAFERDLSRQLTEVLQQLPATLGLSSQHFLVGVSQLAAGADLLFAQALMALGWGHRVLLPQLADDYLAAQGSRGPDFTPLEQQRARDMMQAPHVIETRVVTTAPTRDARFEDTNLAILAEADVLVCLRTAGQRPGAGGTQHLIDRARARGVRVLTLSVDVSAQGLPVLSQAWSEAPFHAPAWPGAAPLLRKEGSTWPEVDAYAQALKRDASQRAGQRRSGFAAATAIIVGTHAAATLLAASVGLVDRAWLVISMLTMEFGLLLWGVWRHHRLHHDRHTADWAQARLCAELARSVLAVGQLPCSLAHLMALPVPPALRPVLRTLHVLQLRHVSRLAPGSDWAAQRQRYITQRLGRPASGTAPGEGQVGYYGRHRARAALGVRAAHWSFVALSCLALVATFLEFGHAWHWPLLPAVLTHYASPAAIFAPVMAVGVMSIAAAFDTEARAHTFADMQAFLLTSASQLSNAASPREVAALVAEIETRLFGETVLWYSRRAFTSVA